MWTCLSCRSRRLVVVLPILVAASSAMVGQDGAWQFDAQSASPVALPPWLSADSVSDALAHEHADQAWGLVVDINRDGATDYVFRYSLSVCGTNCQYAIVDGRSRRRIGLIGGTVLVIRELFINGFPVINTYGHSSADAGRWSTVVFDGEVYVTVGSLHVEGESLNRLFEDIREIPYWSPRQAP